MIPGFTPSGLNRAVEEALQAAYAQGWDDATAAIVEAAKQLRPAAKAGKSESPSRKKGNNKVPSLARVNAEISAREAVEKVLVARPGLQAAEIHRLIIADGMEIKFDAVRAVLSRLTKKRTLLRQGDGYVLPTSIPSHWDLALQSVSGSKFTIKDMGRALDAIGKSRPEPSIRRMLSKMVNAGRLKRISEGVFMTALPRGVSGDELRARGIIPQRARLIGEDAP
jgi:hypothetical protein